MQLEIENDRPLDSPLEGRANVPISPRSCVFIQEMSRGTSWTAWYSVAVTVTEMTMVSHVPSPSDLNPLRGICLETLHCLYFYSFFNVKPAKGQFVNIFNVAWLFIITGRHLCIHSYIPSLIEYLLCSGNCWGLYLFARIVITKNHKLDGFTSRKVLPLGTGGWESETEVDSWVSSCWRLWGTLCSMPFPQLLVVG